MKPKLCDYGDYVVNYINVELKAATDRFTDFFYLEILDDRRKEILESMITYVFESMIGVFYSDCKLNFEYSHRGIECTAELISCGDEDITMKTTIEIIREILPRSANQSSSDTGRTYHQRPRRFQMQDG